MNDTLIMSIIAESAVWKALQINMTATERFMFIEEAIEHNSY